MQYEGPVIDVYLDEEAEKEAKKEAEKNDKMDKKPKVQKQEEDEEDSSDEDSDEDFDYVTEAKEAVLGCFTQQVRVSVWFLFRPTVVSFSRTYLTALVLVDLTSLYQHSPFPW